MNDVYTVSRVTHYLRDLLEYDPFLSDLWIRGEISNWTRARSGHCYFTLKDEGAEIRCVMWRDAARSLPVLPRDGDEVVAAGYVSIYVERGRYQFYVAEMQPLGLGALYKRFEALKAVLAAEGLFDEGRKRPLPPFPRRIGIVTSPTAAALQDIIKVLHRRYPLVHVLLSPSPVQGNEAPDGIVRALRRFEQVAVDFIIIARGGGSIEDLWAFNEEGVARAICTCTAPVVCGVGHEIDYTIADLVADRRAPTPSAAAEIAVPDVRALRERLDDCVLELTVLIEEELASRRQALGQEVRTLERATPERQLIAQRQQVDHLNLRLNRAIQTQLTLQRSELSGLRGQFTNLNPRATLARGYAVIADEQGEIVRRHSDVMPGQPLRVTVQDGEFDVRVEPQPSNVERRASNVQYRTGGNHGSVEL